MPDRPAETPRCTECSARPATEFFDSGAELCAFCAMHDARERLSATGKRALAAPSPVEVTPTSAREDLFARIGAELDRAYAKHGREPWGRHEFYAILLEEVDELWDDIKADADDEPFEKELVQVAAMCFRYFETGDRYRRAPHGRSDASE